MKQISQVVVIGVKINEMATMKASLHNHKENHIIKFSVQEHQPSFHMTSLRGESKGDKSKITVLYNTADKSQHKVEKTLATAVRKMWIAPNYA